MTNPKLEVVAETVFDCSFLDGGVESTLFELRGQRMLAFQGMIPRGPFDRDIEFLKRVPEVERHALYAYLNNRDVQQQRRPAAQRVIIDVYEALCRAGLAAADARAQESWLKSKLPFLYDSLRETTREFRSVLPSTADNRRLVDRWWLFEKPRECARSELPTVLVIGCVGKVLKPLFISLTDEGTGLRVAPTSGLFLVPTKSQALAGLLNSMFFETFVRRSCSSLNTTLRFTPSEVFPYFPFPWKGQPTGNDYISPVLNPPPDVEQRLGPPASVLLKLREEILTQPMKHGLGTAAFSGPTALYNAFDDPGDKRPAIQALREAHMALEAAVLAEYGWGDLAERSWIFDRPWIDGSWRFVPNAETRREYLRRLERLNHEQAAR